MQYQLTFPILKHDNNADGSFAANLLAEITLSYKTTGKQSDLIKVTDSLQAAKVFRDNWDTDSIELREEMKVLLLNNAARCIGIVHLAKGGINSCVGDIRHIFATALIANSSRIIIAHTHPSGNCNPSKADIQLTKKIAKVGELHGIELLDHIIITREGFYSITAGQYYDRGQITDK